MRDIIINPKKTYDLGSIYQNNASEITVVLKKLTEISDKISKDWVGDDSHNFTESFNAHIYELNNFINYLNEYSKILKTDALSHSDTDNQFVKEVERSDLNEKHFN